MRNQCQFTVKRSEKRVVLTVAPEQQPCGVQVVEWVGLVASSFQFFTRLAAVFAEEAVVNGTAGQNWFNIIRRNRSNAAQIESSAGRSSRL